MISRKDVLRTAFSICIAIGIIFIWIVHIAFRADSVWNDSNIIEKYDNWYFVNEKANIQTSDKNVYDTKAEFNAMDFTIQNQLPASTDGMALFFKTYHQTVEVFIDNELVYEFGKDNELLFGKSVGSGYHLVKLSDSNAGKEISMRMTSPYDSRTRKIPEVTIGNTDIILISYIKSQIGAFLVNFTIFLIGLIFIVSEAGFNHRLRSRKALYLGAFAVFYSVWSILQTNVIQLFFNNQILIMYMSYLMLMLIPISVLMLVREYYKMYSERVFTVLIYAYMINFVLCIGLQVTNIADLREMLITTHVLMFISIIYIIYVVLKKRHLNTIIANRTTKVFCIIGFFSVLVDLYRYYFGHMWDTTKFSRISMLVLMIMLGVNYLKSYIEKAGKYTEARILAKLAYQDVMTNMFNRTAYNEDVEIIENFLKDSKNPDDNVVYVLFDLNNLKKINDTHGHTMGDYYIVSMSKIIKKVFEKLGKCYRIGGDEFAVIIRNKSIDDCETAFEELENMVIAENEQSELDFSIAYGYAATLAKDFTSMQNLIMEADKNMYENKKMYKMSMLTTPVTQG